MIWERLIKWQNETIDVLNKHLVEYNEPGMERFNNKELGWVNRTWNNRYIRRAHLDVVDVRETKDMINYTYSSSFNGKIISNLYSNLNSLNIFQLIKLKENYESIGYSATEVKLHLNKIYSVPFYLTLTTIIGALLMFKLNFIKSKFFLIVIGVLVSVIFYYINYFSILFGKNETLPVEISVWLPQILIFLICSLGLIKLNEN